MQNDGTFGVYKDGAVIYPIRGCFFDTSRNGYAVTAGKLGEQVGKWTWNGFGGKTRLVSQPAGERALREHDEIYLVGSGSGDTGDELVDVPGFVVVPEGRLRDSNAHHSPHPKTVIKPEPASESRRPQISHAAKVLGKLHNQRIPGQGIDVTWALRHQQLLVDMGGNDLNLDTECIGVRGAK
jgi:hypothetical protein